MKEKETLEKIKEFKTKFEEFEKQNEDYHALILASSLRDAYSSYSSSLKGEILGFISLFIGMISLLVVAVLEKAISPILGKYLLFIFIFGTLFIYFINFRDYWNNRKKAKEISSLIEDITSDLRKRKLNGFFKSKIEK